MKQHNINKVGDEVADIDVGDNGDMLSIAREQFKYSLHESIWNQRTVVNKVIEAVEEGEFVA